MAECLQLSREVQSWLLQASPLASRLRICSSLFPTIYLVYNLHLAISYIFGNFMMSVADMLYPLWDEIQKSNYSDLHSPLPLEKRYCQSSWQSPKSLTTLLSDGEHSSVGVIQPKVLTCSAAVWDWLSNRETGLKPGLYLCVRSAHLLIQASTGLFKAAHRCIMDVSTALHRVKNGKENNDILERTAHCEIHHWNLLW